MTIKKRFLAPLMVIFIAMGMLIPTTAYANASDAPPAEEVKKRRNYERRKERRNKTGKCFNTRG